MTDESKDVARWKYKQFMKQRKEIADSAEGAFKTFDKAILTFGSAVFGASIAFLKDVAPKPLHSLTWLCVSWGSFAVGLLLVVLSFLFSSRTSISRINDLDEQYRNSVAKESKDEQDKNPQAKVSKDLWGDLTTFCNYACVAFLFFGIAAWIVFAIQNLAK